MSDQTTNNETAIKILGKFHKMPAGQERKGGAPTTYGWSDHELTLLREFADALDDAEARARKQSAENLAAMTLQRVEIREGRLDFDVRTSMAFHMAEEMVLAFDELGGVNYVETRMMHPDRGMFAMTIQKLWGAKSPHELRLHAEAALSALIEAVEDVNHASVTRDAKWQKRALTKQADALGKARLVLAKRAPVGDWPADEPDHKKPGVCPMCGFTKCQCVGGKPE